MKIQDPPDVLEVIQIYPKQTFAINLSTLWQTPKIDLTIFYSQYLACLFLSFLSHILTYSEIKQKFHLNSPTGIVDDYWPLFCCFPLSKEFLEDEQSESSRGSLHTNELLKAVLFSSPDNLASLTRGIQMLQTEDASRDEMEHPDTFQHEQTKLIRIGKSIGSIYSYSRHNLICIGILIPLGHRAWT